MRKRAISLDKINKIVEFTKKDMFRTKIAKEVGVSVSTVYKYQSHFGLI